MLTSNLILKRKLKFLNNVHWYKLEVLSIPSVFTPLTHKSLSSFQFTAIDIKSIINKSDPNKAHGHDMVSIRMIKLCGDLSTNH